MPPHLPLYFICKWPQVFLRDMTLPNLWTVHPRLEPYAPPNLQNQCLTCYRRSSKQRGTDIHYTFTGDTLHVYRREDKRCLSRIPVYFTPTL